MPRSKRAKVVHLSKVEKKGKELTVKTYANVQACVGQYPYLYVFAVDNMRNTYLKEVRVQLGSDSRLFFGKTKVMAKALGSGPESEPAAGLSRLASHVRGSVGLIFSRRDPEAMQSYTANFRPQDYARAGTPATRSFTLPAGTLLSRGGEVAEAEDVPLLASQEPGLRALGVPTRLLRGKVCLDDPYTVCEEGDLLNSNQATLLKMFGVPTAEFRLELRAVWMADGGQVLALADGPDMEMDVDAADAEPDADLHE